MQQLGLAPGPPVPEAPEDGAGVRRPAPRGREDSSNIEANKAVYERMVDEVVNKGNFDVVDELFHPDYVDHVAAARARRRGSTGVKEIFDDVPHGLPGREVHTSTRWSARATTSPRSSTARARRPGEFIGIPPSGKHAVWRSVGFFRVEDGLIREHWGIPDLLGLLIQIGVIPPPDAESAKGTVEAQA